MPLLNEKAKAPDAQTDFGADIEKQKEGSQPDHAPAQRQEEDIPSRFLLLLMRRLFSCGKGETTAEKDEKSHANPYKIDAVPSPAESQEGRGDEWTKQCAHSIKCMEVVEQGGIIRQASDRGVEPRIEHGDAKSERYDAQ